MGIETDNAVTPASNFVSSSTYTNCILRTGGILHLRYRRLSRLNLLLLLLLLLPPDEKEDDADNDDCYNDTNHDSGNGAALDCVTMSSQWESISQMLGYYILFFLPLDLLFLLLRATR